MKIRSTSRQLANVLAGAALLGIALATLAVHAAPNDSQPVPAKVRADIEKRLIEAPVKQIVRAMPVFLFQLLGQLDQKFT